MVLLEYPHPLGAIAKWWRGLKKIPLIHKDSSLVIVMKIFIKDEDRD